jgi:putative aldouronate transport system substrate-binding protein
LRGFYAYGYVDTQEASGMDYFSAMEAGRDFAFIYSVEPGTEQEMSASTGREWEAVPLTTPVISKYDATGSMLAIPSSSKYPERAIMFCEFLYCDAYVLNLLDYGIERQHYDKLDGNFIRLRDNSGYNPGNAWKFGDAFITYLTEGEPADKWSRTEKLTAQSVKLKTLGFWFDGSGLESEITACKAVTARYESLLYGSGTGDVDETVARFADEMKAAGADDVIAEMQRQYDAWREGR